MCAPCVPDNDELVEQYLHHGKMVWVFKERKGQHRQHCLCFICFKFKPGQPDNCPIAQAVYENCVKFNLTTPMYECPEFQVLPGHERVG
jgi:hypothetical protein